jgi:hypothetical protein
MISISCSKRMASAGQDPVPLVLLQPRVQSQSFCFLDRRGVTAFSQQQPDAKKRKKRTNHRDTEAQRRERKQERREARGEAEPEKLPGFLVFLLLVSFVFSVSLCLCG